MDVPDTLEMARIGLVIQADFWMEAQRSPALQPLGFKGQTAALMEQISWKFREHEYI